MLFRSRCGTIPIKRLNGDIDSLKDLIEIFQVQKIIFTEKQLKEIKGDLLDLFLSTHLGLMVVRDSSFIEDNDPGQNKQLSVDSIKIEDLLNREVITTDNDDISSNHKDKCVLITGASGSIGSEIVMQVAQFAPSTIILLDQAESPLYEIELKIKNLFPQLNSVIFIGDIRNKTRMTEVFETFRPDIVYHCAAYKHVPMMERYPAEAIKANVMGTKIISDLAVKYNASKFIMVSTDKAVNPTNVMGASKRIAELYVQSLNNHQRTNGNNFITTRFEIGRAHV